MRETPRDQPENPQEQYEKLLSTGVAIQKEYEDFFAHIDELREQDKDDEADSLEESERPRQLKKKFAEMLTKRVDLLRQIGGIKTIEEVFPRVKTKSKYEKPEYDSADLIHMLMSGKIDRKELEERSKKLLGPQDNEELSDEEMKAYAQARAALAAEMGYENASPEEGWFSMDRNGVHFSMKQFVFRSTFGITGFDRISKIAASREGDERSFNYDRGWDTVVDDPEFQREIDRAIAIFG
jgi:hypothetical protein